MSLSDKTLSALVYTLASFRAPPCATGDNILVFNDLVRFLSRQMSRLPQLLGWALRAGLWVFSIGAVIRCGALFHRCSPEVRGRYLRDWAHSRWGFRRDFVKFFDALTAFALFSRPSFDIPLDLSEPPPS